MNERHSFIKKIGISENIPESMEYFSQCELKSAIDISTDLPDIDEIVSIIVDPKILSSKVIKTMEGISCEGQNLSGCKLLVRIEVNQRIMYAADNSQRSIHVIEDKSFENVHIVVPPFIEGTKVEELLQFQRFNLNVFIEDIVVNRINSRKILTTIYLLSEAKYKPTYEICFSKNDVNGNSQICICYNDGRYSKKLISDYLLKHILPAWSPNGQEIAYLSNDDEKYMLCILNINSNTPRRITDLNVFECVTSFCWNNMGDKIFFSAIKDGNKDLYSVDTKKLTYERLTYSQGIVKSYRPKCSHNGEKIGYIRTVLNANHLYVMDIDGLRLQQISNYGYVRDFDWSIDDRYIAYIVDEKLGSLNIYIVDLNTFKKEFVKIPQSLLYLSKIKYSPEGKYITYIGRDGQTQDIYSYNIEKRVTVNLTKNTHGVRISDYVWKIDGDKIYFSSDSLNYFNIYSLDIERDEIIQITNTESEYMRLTYRPKIG